MTNTIFVQIASYRDPELLPTLRDLLDKASKPKNLKICIAHQFSEEDAFHKDIDVFRKDKRFNILDIPFTEAQGACWARNKIQQEYNGEKYTLQLDSHHRFVEGWDDECIQMVENLQEKGHKKPLLTSYIPSYNPKNDPQERVNTPWAMSFDRFTPEGIIFFLPYYVPDAKEPIPARFFSGHFTFTLGEHARNVQHDPELYFHGEEISLAVRSWTHGYDLFHPHKVIAWHEYTRVGRTKQWDDDITWGDRNTKAHERVRTLLGVDGTPCTPCNKKSFGKYGLGEERTLGEWEVTMGISFTDRSIQPSVLKNEPPMQRDEPFNQRFKHVFGFHKNRLTEDDYQFWAIIFEDKHGIQLYRQDADEQEIKGYLRKDDIEIWREYNGEVPSKWIVWPFSKEKGWMDKIEGQI